MFGMPIPPAPASSKSLLADIAERGISFVPNHLVRALDPACRVAILDVASEMPYDLFLGNPKHRVPDVVVANGITENGCIPVAPKTLKTRFPRVYAVGDVTSVGTPKAGMFAEEAARVVAEALLAEVQGGEQPPAYSGTGPCYVEFGRNLVGRVDVDFHSRPAPTGSFMEPSVSLSAERQLCGSNRTARWFGP
jgi:sulfide:quinone oxidoreductase